jgi:hypothetical protein
VLKHNAVRHIAPPPSTFSFFNTLEMRLFNFFNLEIFMDSSFFFKASFSFELFAAEKRRADLTRENMSRLEDPGIASNEVERRSIVIQCSLSCQDLLATEVIILGFRH